MLFSDDQVASYVNERFEPVWVSVRPVPLVTIDFGNGTVVTRTLHGNVATYVCQSDGRVLDVLPGVYLPQIYMEQLGQLDRLHQSMAHADERTGSGLFREHHENALAEGSAERATARYRSISTSGLASPLDTTLHEDTRINETSRRAAIHGYLVEQNPVTPDEMKHWLYREVLHADLDDPWLGLGETLFSSYPFAGEDGLVE